MKSKETKRKEEALRQEIYNSMTPGEKLDKISTRPGNSKKEVARIKEGVK